MNRTALAAILSLAAFGGAHAADMAPPPPPPDAAPDAVAQVSTPQAAGGRWNGFTLGLSAGGFATPTLAESQNWFPPSIIVGPIPTAYSFKANGGSVGAQLGFNRQIGQFVVGGVADYSAFFGAAAKQSAAGVYPIPGTPGIAFTTAESEKLQSLGTIRGKLGFAPSADWMVYGTGGLAYGQANVSTNLTFDNGIAFAGSRTSTIVGWAGGGGVEYALGPQWSVALEGLYYDLGKAHAVGFRNAPLPGGGSQAETNASFEFKGYSLRLGVNYLIDDGASVASAASAPQDPAGAYVVTTGVRAAMSTGSAKLNLYDSTGSTLISRLSYAKATAPAAEVYGRLDSPGTGYFLAGYAGIGKLNGGNLQDEDFPPLTVPYSSTNGPQADGQLNYASADFGYYAWDNGAFKIGGLVGGLYLNETFNSFSCTQTATSGICAPGQVGAGNLTISDTGKWGALRVGLAGQATFGPVTVRGTAAWLPYIAMSESNTHWLRTPYDFTGPIPANATGSNGYQLEGEAVYVVGPSLEVGLGARYWSMNAKGHVNFQFAAPGAGPQVATFSTQRATAYVETAYRF